MHSVNKTIPPKIRTKTPHKLTYHTSTPLSIGEFPAFLNRQHCMESPWFFVRVCEVSTGPNGWDVATWTLAVEWGDHLGCFLGEGEKRWIFTKQYGYGSIPIDTFLVGWTSIYQLFWGSLGTRVLTHPHMGYLRANNMDLANIIQHLATKMRTWPTNMGI